MSTTLTPSHRGGSGTPLVCLHGFTDTWRTWELVLPALEREHDVLAPTLLGHWGAPSIEGEIDAAALVDGVERAMDEAGFETAHVAGNSLGGYVALQHVDAIVATPEGRRRATAFIATNYEHIPAELIAHQIRGAAYCEAANPLIEHAAREGWPLDPGQIECPVRVVWGTHDKILQWPGAVARFRDQLPHADWVELDGIGHCPQLDVPLETAELITGFSARIAV